jgi:predicted RNA-binding protein with PIN domain
VHYYIDGYNLLFRIKHSGEDFSLERQKLIEDLNEQASFLDLNLSLVFDAQYQESESSKSHYQNLEILFTSFGETADDYILKVIQNEPEKAITVVTSDKKLAYLAKMSHAKTETIEEFLDWLNRRSKNVKNKKTKKSKELLNPPKKKKLVGNFDYYLEEFEKRDTPNKNVEKKEEKKYLTDKERWLKLFSEESEEV